MYVYSWEISSWKQCGDQPYYQPPLELLLKLNQSKVHHMCGMHIPRRHSTEYWWSASDLQHCRKWRQRPTLIYHFHSEMSIPDTAREYRLPKVSVAFKLSKKAFRLLFTTTLCFMHPNVRYTARSVPEHLSYEEALTLALATFAIITVRYDAQPSESVAGVTAYATLTGPVPLKGGDTVLVLGTGGVSMSVNFYGVPTKRRELLAGILVFLFRFEDVNPDPPCCG